MKLKVGKQKIIDSGTVLFDSTQKLEFDFDEYNLKFVFQFSKSIEKPEPHFTIEVISQGNFLLVTLFNFENGQDTGNTVPLRLAQVNGELLSLKFRITAIGQENPDIIFNYSWYLDVKEVANG